MKIQDTPFWETLDGTVVRGTEVTRCVNDGITAGGYFVRSYEELAAALADIETKNLTSEITIRTAESFEITKTVTIKAGRNIVLENYDETEPVTKR